MKRSEEKMKMNWLITAATVAALCLTACGANNDNAGDNTNYKNQSVENTNNTTRSRFMNVRNDTNNLGENVRESKSAEREVEKLDEVADAHVMISGKKAYVAVRLSKNSRNNTNVNRNNNGSTFLGNGRVNQDNNNKNTDDGRIDGNDDAGKKVNNTNIVGRNVANNNRVTNNGSQNQNRTNNFIGINENNGNNTNGTAQYSPVSNAFERKVANAVRRKDSRIHQVYVSANPDFYDRVKTFAEDIRGNNNNDGLFDRFNDIIDDFFGTGNTDGTNAR